VKNEEKKTEKVEEETSRLRKGKITRSGYGDRKERRKSGMEQRSRSYEGFYIQNLTSFQTKEKRRNGKT